MPRLQLEYCKVNSNLLSPRYSDKTLEDVASMGNEMQTAKQDMEEQRIEMQGIGDVVDKVMGHVEKLTAAFQRIDEERERANVVHVPIVNSTPAHV